MSSDKPMTTPSAASTAEELHRVANQILKFGGKSLTTRDDFEISCALRELAALKESAQRQDSAYEKAIAEWLANPENEITDELDQDSAMALSEASMAIHWIECRAAQIAKETSK